ncbi:MAG: Flp pilus assembly complex ATPase component TadA [Pseudomonadaceae bacterium]|nr:Flp pilus assembly complex ATPase component TadA [Pseudomonadaceae bacterium]
MANEVEQGLSLEAGFAETQPQAPSALEDIPPETVSVVVETADDTSLSFDPALPETPAADAQISPPEENQPAPVDISWELPDTGPETPLASSPETTVAPPVAGSQPMPSIPVEPQAAPAAPVLDDVATETAGESPVSSAPAIEDGRIGGVADILGQQRELNEQERHYSKVLTVLNTAKDLGVDAVARSQIEAALRSNKLPQVACRELLSSRTINRVQMARAMARVNRAREIMSFLDVPSEALGLRQTLPPRIIALLRKERIVPLSAKHNDEDQQITELHLAHDKATRDVVLENKLAEMLPPDVKFHWHFILREVAGAYWLAGESESIDTGMEAEALLDRIIGNAADARASDIHIDPSIKGEPRAIVKYRVDGFVHPKEVITMEQLDRLRVRIENLARMPKVNLNHTNKGAFTRSGYDWRVQIQPHAGRLGPVPRIVLRRLQPDVMPLEVLGYPHDFIDKIKSAASAANGVILWTGPTGSGKTESIHAAVVSVNPMAKGLSVHTIEDPPEKRVPGYAVQMEIAEEDPARSGLQLLKSSLRADPDVVIFGEVRDNEMAKLVFEAANTGHLVFSTLHTNTALDAIIRLSELGINGFLLSYVRGIAAQRLLRRLCVHCKIKMEGEPDDYTKYVFDRYDVPLEGADLYVANMEGCASCNFTGYYGRVAAAEWLRPTRELIDASLQENFDQLEDMARRAGWQPMGRMGVEHVARGITDAGELASKILELGSEQLVS